MLGSQKTIRADQYHSPNAVNHSRVGAPQREVYFMGLIDVLTQYDTMKKAAHAAKAVKHGVRVVPERDWLAYGVFTSLSCTGLLSSSTQSCPIQSVCVCFAGRSRNLDRPPGAVR